ncbi:hypothetical protein Xen7305DRAFT_00021350 [Xenococcus sp. PCC 7305]|uniref:zinc dependent phospholipase C family protein n=1 Tax=Xenococcus sp. PCC 7305 TaxID=102125 RepID=UPI0002AD079F|nr:zinc dependent phospholipase C family protein [Xenococcus sp. PCC 7305]ELS02421.1 hypothetical protein Xen7305DRAFT_00021350 [Xenococcus sp. PCC 7305]
MTKISIYAFFKKTLYKASIFLLAFLLIFSEFLVKSPPAFAWIPKTHVYLAEQARDDAIDDGKVTINKINSRGEIISKVGDYNVDSSILQALRSNPEQYRAGVIGPDAYPDLLTGQQTIHSDNTKTGGTNSNQWLDYLWRKSDESPYKTLPVKAFVIGYLTHAAGDIYGHTFVNYFTGGKFELGENALKHIVLERYVGKRTPKLSSYDISIDGVREFLYREMVDARPGEELYELLKGGGSEYSVPRIFSKLRAELQRDIDDYDNTINKYNRRIDEKKRAARDCDPLDFGCSAVALRSQAAAIEVEKQGFIVAQGWKRAYKVEWRKDIERGLREWPVFSHDLAKATFNPEGIDFDRVKELSGDYVENHLILMAGAPDLSIDFLSVIKDVLSPIPFIEQQIERIERDLLNYLLKQGTGYTLEEIEKYLKNPERYFDEVMGRGQGTKTSLESFNRDTLNITDKGFDDNFRGSGAPEFFNYERFAAAYNTVVVSKLLLLPTNEINRLLRDLDDNNTLTGPNIMLGFVKTLDGSNEQQKMLLAQQCETYRQLFVKQAGEDFCLESIATPNNSTFIPILGYLLQ